MKIKNIVFVLLGILLVTVFVVCSNKDEEDAERISVMEEKVDALFNQEKTDLAENVETKQFDEIDELLEAEDGEEFSQENALRIESVVLHLSEAVGMYEFQEQVLKLVSEDGVVNEDVYLEIKEHVAEFEDKELFYERQVKELEEIEELYQQQLAQKEHVDKTEKAMAKLFTDDKVIKNVTKKDYDKVAKLVKGIEDKDLKESLETELKKVDKKLKAIAKAEKEAEEKRIAEEKRLAEEKKKEEERQLAEQQKKQQAQAQASNQGSNKSSNQQSSQSETKKSTQSSKQSTASASGGNKSNSSNKGNEGNNNGGSSNNGKNKDEEPLYGGMTGQEIADWINNGDCEKTGEGYIGGGDYNTWESYSCK